MAILFPELHRPIWPRQCQAGAAGSEQTEDTEKDGGWRTDRASDNGQG